MIVRTQIEGTRLAGNLLDDPTERDLFVYLPPGYSESERRYPTAYLLHAYGDTARISGFEAWSIGGDGLIASSLGRYDKAEYERQLDQGVEEPYGL